MAAGGIGLAAEAFLGERETKPITGPTGSPTPPARSTLKPDFDPSHSDRWGAPTALSLTCTREPWGIEPLSSEVPAQPDGVHIVVNNAGGAAYLTIEMRGRRPIPQGDRTDRLSLLDPDPDGFTRAVAPWPPGPVEIACEAPGIDQRSETVEVTDPRGNWVPDGLACEETVEFERESFLFNADMQAAVRDNVRGVLPTDEILRAGYPLDPFPAATMLVVRDGDPVAALLLIYVGSEGGWYPFIGEICAGTGIMGA